MVTPSALHGHGGRLGAARTAFPHAPTPWLDLSTGINPSPYPLPEISPEAWSRLPDPQDLRTLERAAARSFGVDDPDRVVAAPGSDLLIRLLPRLLGVKAVTIPARTYRGHEDAWRAVGARISHDEDAACEARVLVNPNNPDGRALAAEEVLGLDARWLIVDEAFVEVEPALSVAPLAGTPRHEGRIVLRSFGKFHGLAGARLGFLVGAPDLAARVRDALGDWPVPGPSLVVATAAYADVDWAQDMRSRLRDDAAQMDALLRLAGFVVEGGTSLFRLTSAPDAIRRFEALARQGVLVRPFAWDETLLRFGLPGRKGDWLRLAKALEAIG
ncbi:MAG: pyridoxal phosphate-dependent class II aminotransferase [Caulobacter sp.]|nr:pyridoxal phosphate-dependent class II aminotransferase [Caulobacter sp.]